MKCCAYAVVTFAIILESVCAHFGDSCGDIVTLGELDYFGAFTEFTEENLIGTYGYISMDAYEPTSTWKKYRTDVFVFTEDNSTKTLEEVEEDIILESAYHRNGTVWMSTSNGIYKYTQGDEYITMYTIKDNVSSRVIKQLTILNDTLNIVLENNKVLQIIEGKFVIECPPKLLTGYHIAVDANCRVYYVKTYYHFRNVHSYTATAVETDSLKPSYVVDYRNNKVYRSYAGGIYFHSPEDVLNITGVSVTYSDVHDMAIDNQGNIFIRIGGAIFVLFTVSNVSCTFADPTGARFSFFPPSETLKEYTQHSQDIISEDSCIVRRINKKTNITLTVTLIGFLVIGLLSLVLAFVALYKMIARGYVSKLNTPVVAIQPPSNYEIKCGSTDSVYEGNDYESIVYDNHYEVVDTD